MLFIAIVAVSVLYPSNANNTRLQEHLYHSKLEWIRDVVYLMNQPKIDFNSPRDLTLTERRRQQQAAFDLEKERWKAGSKQRIMEAAAELRRRRELEALRKAAEEAKRLKLQMAVDHIFTDVLSESTLFKRLKEAEIKNVLLVQDIPSEMMQFKNLLTNAGFKVAVTSMPRLDPRVNGIEYPPEMAKLVKHQTLVVDFDPSRFLEIRRSFPVILRPIPFSLQGFKSLSASAPPESFIKSGLNRLWRVPRVQLKIDRIFSDTNLTFSDKTVRQLQDLGINFVILPLEVPDDLNNFQEQALSRNFEVCFIPIKEGAKNLKQQIELYIPSSFDFAHTLVVDWDRDRLYKVSKHYPVVMCGYHCQWYSMVPYRPYSTKSFRMTQGKLNDFIAEKRKANGELNARELVEFLHEGKIQAVAMKFHGVVVGRRGPLLMKENFFWKEQKEYMVSDDLRVFVQELRRIGIQFFVIDYSDDRMMECLAINSMEPIIAGGKLMDTALFNQQIYPSERVGYFPNFSPKVRGNKILGPNPDNLHVPFSTVYHLNRLVKLSNLQRKSILLIDDNLCNCQKVLRHNYPAAIYVDHLLSAVAAVDKTQQRGSSGFHFSALSPVSLGGLAETGHCPPNQGLVQSIRELCSNYLKI